MTITFDKLWSMCFILLLCPLIGCWTRPPHVQYMDVIGTWMGFCVSTPLAPVYLHTLSQCLEASMEYGCAAITPSFGSFSLSLASELLVRPLLQLVSFTLRDLPSLICVKMFFGPTIWREMQSNAMQLGRHAEFL